MMMAQEMLPPFAVLPPLAAPSAADEANQRVANHLQLLAALISVEARNVTDPEGLAVLQRTQQRIAAVGGVHRQLYKGGCGEVDLGAYLDDVGEQLADSCPEHRTLLVNADPVLVASGVATSIGILATELVTNACEHAYSADERGGIFVSLSQEQDGSLLFIVEDRGRGRRAGKAIPGLGSRLIDATVTKLRGSATIEDARPGTRFRMTFRP